MQRTGGALDGTGGALQRTGGALDRTGGARQRTGEAPVKTVGALQRTGGAQYRVWGAKERYMHVLPLEPAAAHTAGPLILFTLYLVVELSPNAETWCVYVTSINDGTQILTFLGIHNKCDFQNSRFFYENLIILSPELH